MLGDQDAYNEGEREQETVGLGRGEPMQITWLKESFSGKKHFSRDLESEKRQRGSKSRVFLVRVST